MLAYFFPLQSTSVQPTDDEYEKPRRYVYNYNMCMCNDNEICSYIHSIIILMYDFLLMTMFIVLQKAK